MPPKPSLSYECIEQLHAWVHCNCPCALENGEFLPGLWAILEDEIERAVIEAKQQAFRRLNSPSVQ